MLILRGLQSSLGSCPARRMAGPRNAFERRVDAEFKRLGAGARYESLQIPYNIDYVYNPDWILPNGTVVEGKGRLTPDEKRKMIAVKRCNPHLKIVFVFYDAHKKISGTKQTHAGWAEKNGFGWSHELPLEEWIG